MSDGITLSLVAAQSAAASQPDTAPSSTEPVAPAPIAEAPNVPAAPEEATAQSAGSVPASAVDSSGPETAAPAEGTPSPEPVGVPTTPVAAASSLSVADAATVFGLFRYIDDGFENYSVMIGMNRFYEVGRALKARASTDEASPE